jgi:hypothetical protein
MSNALFSALSSLLPRRNAGARAAGRRGRRSAASTAPGSRALAEGLEGRVLLAVTVLSNGTGDGSLRVTVDAYGSYGSAAFPADDAFYDPIGPTVAQGSTFQSAVFLTGFNNFLTESSFTNTFPPLPGAAFTSTTSNSAVSSFSAGGFGFVLTQSVAPSVNGSTILSQQYVVTNNSGVAQNFQLIRHVDGDMFFVGGLGNDFAGVSAGRAGSCSSSTPPPTPPRPRRISALPHRRRHPGRVHHPAVPVHRQPRRRRRHPGDRQWPHLRRRQR